MALLFAQTTTAQPKTDLGRDFWFCIPQNYDRVLDNTRYFYLYITATSNTTINVQIGGAPVITRSATAFQTIALRSPTDISKSNEMLTSGVVEKNKSIHVWSEDADLSVSFFSQVPSHTSEGMYCIPTIGWGTQYVVASYNSLINDSDEPSEFTIVANQDNTTVTITPSSDIRKDASVAVIGHPKGTSFSVTLNKGECIQYQTAGRPYDGTDLSGSLIVADRPIGVEGASACPEIPTRDNTCNYILEMLLPIRAWGKQYFTAQFTDRKYGGDGFMVVGSKQGQIVNRNGLQAAVLTNIFDFVYLYDITNTSYWTSDAPFMLVQYILCASHANPGPPSLSNRNNGNPAMLIINPAEQYTNQLVFNIPSRTESFSADYLTVVSPRAHHDSLLLDGRRIGSWNNVNKTRSFIIDSIWEAIEVTFSNLAEGSHILISDSLIGAFIYGYALHGSYAMSCGLGTKTINGLEAAVHEHLPLNFGFTAEAITPNPLIGKRTLIASYSLQSQAPLRLELFDQLGNSVAVLLSSDLHPEGIFEKQINIPSDLATGIYYYRYTCGSTHISGKLVIVK